MAHDKRIIQWDIKKLTKIKEFHGFGTKGYHRSFAVSELTFKIYGIDFKNPKAIRVQKMNHKKVELIDGSKAPILCLIRSYSKPVLYTLAKDNQIYIWNLNNRKILKTISNISKFDIRVLSLSNKGQLFTGGGNDKLKIIYDDSIIRTFDVMNFGSTIDCISISSNSKYVFVGGENQVINIIKEVGLLVNSSSGSGGSFESLRTLSSNDMEKRNKDGLNMMNIKGLQSVIYGQKTQKRKTLNAPATRMSGFSNNKKLLTKGSYEIRYRTLKSDSFVLHPRKTKADLSKLMPLMSIYEEGEKRNSPDKQNENNQKNILNLDGKFKTDS